MEFQPIRFHHRGSMVEVEGVPPTRTVLEWLREDARCTGTKEGCNEGDCGACTVVVGTPEAQGLRLHGVNACLQFLPTLDGKALFSVEDLKTDAGLHPAQQAMIECHGSQCGFCTPGFVMSLWLVYEQHRARGTRPTRQALADALSGNLCRCTGYRPILDAGERMFELPARPLDVQPVLKALSRPQQGDEGLHYAALNLQQRPARLDHFHAPRSLDALAALYEQHPDARLLAGGTDIGLWVNKQFRDLGETLLHVGEVRELQGIEERGGELLVGAGASLEAAWRALVQRVPALAEMWLRFASPPIRQAGTMGGNLANGSPIGDSAPVLMALDAQLLLRRGAQQRRVPLSAFYRGYMQNQLQRGEFVQAIALPLPAPARQVRAYKLSKRFDCDISAVCAGLSIELNGDAVAQVRLAFGGMAATTQRAATAEAALQGRPWDQAALRDAQSALAHDFTPLSDMRGSAAYRLQAAQNLLQRFWLETRPRDPLPPEATRAWNVQAHEAEAAR